MVSSRVCHRSSLRTLTLCPHCVQRYLCIGEAPDLSAQAFQQRSRWSKGHFQTFYSSECPLFDQRLNLFFRLAYSSTCVGYLSTGAQSSGSRSHLGH